MSRARPFQTDALNPSALPGSSRRHLPSRPLPGLDPDADTLADGDRQKVVLQAEYDAWNQRIDREMKACAGGLRELVSIADLGPNPSADRNAVLSLSLRLRTSSLIASLQSLRNTAHELKLTLLLADQTDAVRRRDAEALAVREEIRVERKKVGTELQALLGTGEDKEETATGGDTQPALAPSGATITATTKNEGILPEIRTEMDEAETTLQPEDPIPKEDIDMEEADDDDDDDDLIEVS